MSYYVFFILLPVLGLFLSRFFSHRWGIVNARKSIYLSSIISLLFSILSIVWVYSEPHIEFKIFERYGLGISFRLDALSVMMYSMISILSFIIIKYSDRYLEGDRGRVDFLGKLSATIGSVYLIILSNNLLMFLLAWIITSVCLHQLLTFYKERRRAKLAARKKFISARISETFLLISFVLLYLEWGTGDFSIIFERVVNITNPSFSLTIAAFSLALSAVFKSAQFPFYGWLIEVMETPTPVSALLHAGLLNAGPFLMVRFGVFMVHFEGAQSLLILLGGFTAFMASLAYLTQPAIKTALGYSSMAHMGFMLLVCGLGVYPAAMLHLVAHSFYKAHAFLSSGSGIEMAKSSRIKGLTQGNNKLRLFLGYLLVISIYITLSALWGINPFENLALFATGLMIVLGLIQIVSPAVDSSWNIQIFIRSIGMILIVTMAFFSLESFFHHLLENQIPFIPELTLVRKVTLILVLFVFITTVLVQSSGQLFQKKEVTKWGLLVRNGFYANAYLDKMIGALKRV